MEKITSSTLKWEIFECVYTYSKGNKNFNDKYSILLNKESGQTYILWIDENGKYYWKELNKQ